MRRAATKTAGTICSSGPRKYHFTGLCYWTQPRCLTIHTRHPASTTPSSLTTPSSGVHSSSSSSQDEHNTQQRDDVLSKPPKDKNESSTDVTLNWSFEEFEKQCCVERVDDLDILVNQARYRHDFALWAALLRHRSRVDGAAGVLSIWQGMCVREVRIPSEGQLAAEIWRLVIEASHEQDNVKEVVDQIVKTHRKTGKIFPGVYKLLIGLLLRKRPKNAWPTHRRLKELGVLKTGTLSLLVRDASSSSKALQIFERIYRDSNDATLYDAMITTLCEKQRHLEAVYWHDLLTSRGDYASSTEITEPLRAHLNLKRRIHRKSDSRHLAHAALTLPSYHARFVSEVPGTPSTLSRFFMNKVLGEKHGISQKYISDGTCAKALATRAFSVDFVIRSLSAFGVEAIGPLGLRELGLRSVDAPDLITHIKLLNKLNIKVEDCLYSQLILKIASDEKSELLKVLLISDQHPEVFEDKDLQDKLLTQHLRNEDWPQAHIALLALTHGHDYPKDAAYNVLLRARIKSGNIDLIQPLVDEMIQNGVRISRKTIRHAFFQLVPTRQPGRGPVIRKHRDNGLDSFIAMLVRMMRQGHPVDLAVWRQPLVYLGMTGRINDLEVVSIWLSLVYSKKLPAHERPAMLRALFPLNLQKAMVTWGFRSVVKLACRRQLFELLGPALLSPSLTSPLSPTQSAQTNAVYAGGISNTDPARIFHLVATEKFFSRAAPWTRGVALLRMLKHCGVEVDAGAVRSACLQRFIQLFGNRGSARRVNRFAKRRNRASLLALMKSVNLAWGSTGEKLFPFVNKNVGNIMLEKQVRTAVLGLQKQHRHSTVLSRLRRHLE